MYNNVEALPGFPDTRNRDITFVVADGEGALSDVVTAVVTFDSVNDAPIVDVNGIAIGNDYTATFVEEQGMCVHPLSTWVV